MFKIFFRSSLVLSGLAYLSQAQAAGLLQCDNVKDPTNRNGIALSYIHMGATDDGSAQGDGTVRQLPLVVHASLVNFDSLFKLALSGAVSNACVLGITLPDGTLLTFQLSNLLVKRVTANANSETTEHGPYAYTAVTFTYTAATLVGGSGGTDDGGLGPTGGWDVGANKAT